MNWPLFAKRLTFAFAFYIPLVAGCIDEPIEDDPMGTNEAAVQTFDHIVAHLDYRTPSGTLGSTQIVIQTTDAEYVYRLYHDQPHKSDHTTLYAIGPAMSSPRDDTEISGAIAYSDKVLNTLRLLTPAEFYQNSLNLVLDRFKEWFECDRGHEPQYRKMAADVAAEIATFARGERDRAKGELAEKLARKRVALAQMSKFLESERDDFTRANKSVRELLARHSAHKATEASAFQRLQAIAATGARARLGELASVEEALRDFTLQKEASYARNFEHDAKRVQGQIGTIVSAHAATFAEYKEFMSENGLDDSVETATKKLTDLIEQMLAYSGAREREVEDAVRKIGIGIKRRRDALVAEEQQATRPTVRAGESRPVEEHIDRRRREANWTRSVAQIGLHPSVAPSAAAASPQVKSRASILIGLAELRREGIEARAIDDIVAALERGNTVEAAAKYDAVRRELTKGRK